MLCGHHGGPAQHGGHYREVARSNDPDRPVAGQSIAVMGSITPWYEATCLAFGARPFTIDYNPIISKSARLEVATVLWDYGYMKEALLVIEQARRRLARPHLLAFEAGVLPGERKAPGVGAGTELFQLRPYQPGDDVRQLDAAASARTGIPHVRLQVPERALTTWLVLDVSPSMAFGTADRLKADVAEGVVLVLGRLAARRGGRVALLTSGSRIQRFLPHSHLIPRAACVVCHGGMGIVQKTLAAGVPLCVVPFGRDQLETAGHVTHCGAGTRVAGKPVDLAGS